MQFDWSLTRTSELIEFSQLKLYFSLITIIIEAIYITNYYIITLLQFRVYYRGCRDGTMSKKAVCISFIHQKNS